MKVSKVFSSLMAYILTMATLGIAQVNVSIPDTSADKGNSISIPINVSDLTGLGVISYQFTVTFDENVLDATGASSGGTLTSGWGSPYCNTSSDGRVTVGSFGVTELSGSGTLVKLDFDVVGNPVETTNLSFSFFIFNDGSPSADTSGGTFTVNPYPITVTITTNIGSGTTVVVDGQTRNAPYQTIWDAGSSHTIGVDSLQSGGSGIRYLYASWSDSGAQTHQVSPISDITYTATLTTQYYLTVSSPWGNPQGEGWYGAGTTANFSVESEVNDGQGTRYLFESWTGSGNGAYSGNENPGTVTMNGPITETAVWDTEYYLTVVSVRGTPQGEGWYDAGDTATFSVDNQVSGGAGARYVFSSWAGSGNGSYDGSNNPATVTMNSPITETANWTTQYYLTVNSIRGNPQGEGWYDAGDTATFSVDSLVNEGPGTRYLFSAWTGSGTGAYTGSDRIISLVMNGPIVETASWDTQYYLTVSSVRGNPQGEGWYYQGTTVQISVDSLVIPVPGTRYLFNSWSGTGAGSYTGNNPIASVTMNAPITETASWDTQFYLTVATEPPGVIDISGAGWYDSGIVATTGTAPAKVDTGGASYDFKGWKVDGSAVEGNPISITMDTSHVATADYNPYVTVVITTSIGSGTYVFVDSVKREASYTAYWQAGSSHTIGVDMYQQGSPGTRYVYSSWSDGGDQTHTISPTVNTSYTADLITQHYLTVGTEPQDITYITGDGWYDHGATVFTGTAPLSINSGEHSYQFNTWKMDGIPVNGNPVQALMDGPHIAIAYYNELYSISGKVTLQGKGLKNVKLSISGPVSETVFTDDNGNYAFRGLLSNNYTVTPTMIGFIFDPPSRSYSPLDTTLVNQNFTATDTLRPEVILISPNGGETLIAGTLDTIRWIATDNVSVDSISLGYSLDSGTTWNVISTDEINDSTCVWNVPDTITTTCRVSIFVVDAAGNMNYDQSDADFSITRSSEVDDPSGSGIPHTFDVSQNYPNPFNPTTCIEFQLPGSSQVTIKIFNLRGQEVRLLLDEFAEAGYHTAFWDGNDNWGNPVSSGIYYYQVKAGGFIKTKPMILSK